MAVSNRINELLQTQPITNFAVGCGVQNLDPVASFIAPRVEVPMRGTYKSWDTGSRLRTNKGQARRAYGGAAVLVGNRGGTDISYVLQPNGMDYLIDNEYLQGSDTELRNELMAGADELASRSGLLHLNEVYEYVSAVTALETLSAAAVTNLVDKVDSYIRNAILVGRGLTPTTKIKMLCGVDAWRRLRNHSSVVARVNGGSTTDRPGNVQMSQLETDGLFMVPIKGMVNLAVQDTGTEETPAAGFVGANDLLIFLSSDAPSRNDPSFLKTFHTAAWMKEGGYESEDGRLSYLKIDWTSQVMATNTGAAIRVVLND